MKYVQLIVVIEQDSKVTPCKRACVSQLAIIAANEAINDAQLIGVVGKGSESSKWRGSTVAVCVGTGIGAFLFNDCYMCVLEYVLFTLFVWVLEQVLSNTTVAVCVDT